MHVIVVGAGVVGMTTAHYLVQRGCEVTVVDRARQVAAGASYANGAQLSYSYTDALASPAFLKQLPRLLMGADTGVRIAPSLELAAWGARFLAQCTTARARANTLAVLELGLRSAALMRQLPHALDFDYRPAGKLVLLSNAADVDKARRSTALKAANGSDVDLLSRADAVALEPALDAMHVPIEAAVYSRGDAVGNSRQFCAALAAALEATGRVRLELGTEVDRIVVENGRVQGVLADRDIGAGTVVVCAGAGSPRLLAPLRISAPIYPVRGYSLTLPAGDATPSISITSAAERIVICRLGERVRIAGFADFHGFDTSRDAGRIASLVNVAQRLAPDAADYAMAEHDGWGGFRPMTPSGRPLVGATRTKGLYLNTGHGMLGWTLACATADTVARAVSETEERKV